MRKRIELSSGTLYSKTLLDAESINRLNAHITNEPSPIKKAMVEIGESKWLVGSSRDEDGGKALYEEAVRLIGNVEDFIYNDTAAQKMVIKFGEFNKLVEKGYADVYITLCEGTDTTYKIDDEAIDIECSCTTTRFSVRIYDVESLSNEDVIELGKKKLFASIGEKSCLDFIDVERTKAVYKTTHVKVSYE